MSRFPKHGTPSWWPRAELDLKGTVAWVGASDTRLVCIHLLFVSDVTALPANRG